MVTKCKKKNIATSIRYVRYAEGGYWNSHVQKLVQGLPGREV